MGLLDDVGGQLFGTDDVPEHFVDPTPEEFRGLRGPTAGSLEDIIRGISGSDRFSGTDTDRLVAPISDAEQELIDIIKGLSSGPTAFQQQGRDLFGRTINGDFLDPSSNPFLQSTIDSATRRINEGNNQNQAALIGQFKRAGQTLRTDPNRVGSSSFLNQARLGERDRLNAIGDVTGNILNQNFQAERGRQQDAAKAAETISTQDIGNAIEGLKAQALPRLIKDMGLQRGIAEFNKRIQTLLQALGISGGLSSQAQQFVPKVDGDAGSLPTLIAGGITGGLSSGGTSLASLISGGGGGGGGLGPNASNGGTGFGFGGF